MPLTFGPRLRESITAVTITRVAPLAASFFPFGRDSRSSSTGTYVFTNCFVSRSTRAQAIKSEPMHLAADSETRGLAGL